MLDNRLERAAERGETENVLAMLKETQITCPEEYESVRYQALLWASIGNQVDTTNALLGIGANVNSVHMRGHRILSEAVRKGCIDTVRILIANGAEINAIDKWGKTALHYAIMKKTGKSTRYYVSISQLRLDLLKLLLDSGADSGVIDSSGKSAFDYALLYSQKDIEYRLFVDILRR